MGGSGSSVLHCCSISFDCWCWNYYRGEGGRDGRAEVSNGTRKRNCFSIVSLLLSLVDENTSTLLLLVLSVSVLLILRFVVVVVAFGSIIESSIRNPLTVALVVVFLASRVSSSSSSLSLPFVVVGMDSSEKERILHVLDRSCCCCCSWRWGCSFFSILIKVVVLETSRVEKSSSIEFVSSNEMRWGEVTFIDKKRSAPQPYDNQCCLSSHHTTLHYTTLHYTTPHHTTLHHTTRDIYFSNTQLNSSQHTDTRSEFFFGCGIKRNKMNRNKWVSKWNIGMYVWLMFRFIDKIRKEPMSTLYY